MTSGFVSLVVAFFGFVWRMISNRYLLGAIVIFLIFFFISSGGAFGLVFQGFIITFLVAIVLSFWIKWIRPVVAVIMGILVLIWLSGELFKPFPPWLHKKLPALTEWQETSKEKANIKIQESSLSMKNTIRDSEVTVGTFGKMNKNSVGYDDFGHEANGPTIKTGQAVKSMGKIKPQNKENGDQGLMQIALPNLKTDEFVNVRVVWVPIQSVTWEKLVKEEEKKVTVTPPPPVIVPSQTIVTPPPPAPVVAPKPPPVQKVAPPPVHVVTPKEAQLARVRAGQEQQGSAVWVEPPQQRRVYYPEPWQYRQERRYHHEPPRHHDRYYDRW